MPIRIDQFLDQLRAIIQEHHFSRHSLLDDTEAGKFTRENLKRWAMCAARQPGTF